MTYHNAAAILADPATAVVERAALTKAFEIVHSVVEARNHVAVLGNARIVGDGAAVFVTATDLDVEITARVPAAADSRFGVTLPSGRMRDLLKKATASDLVAFTMPDVETIPGKDGMPDRYEFNGAATVDFERVKYRLQAIHPSDFPEMTAGLAVKRFALSGAVLWGAIDATMAAMSTEETRYYLNGIFMHHVYGGPLRLVATDGHRLYMQDVAAPEGCEGMAGVIVPRKTVALLHKLTKGKACPETVLIEVSDTKIRFMWGNITMTSKLVDGTFPDYNRATPSFAYVDANSATFDPADMLEAVRAVTLIASERGRAVKMTMDSDSIRLDVNNPDAGSATADVVAEFTGPDGFEVGYNAGYLVDVIATASPDGGPVVWQGTDTGAPAVFTGSREGWKAVLMPMRV